MLFVVESSKMGDTEEKVFTLEWYSAVPFKLERAFESLEDILQGGLWFSMLGVQLGVEKVTWGHEVGDVSLYACMYMGRWIHMTSRICLSGSQVMLMLQLLGPYFETTSAYIEMDIWTVRLRFDASGCNMHQAIIVFLAEGNCLTLSGDAWASSDFRNGHSWWFLIEWFFSWSSHASLLVTVFMCMHNTLY